MKNILSSILFLVFANSFAQKEMAAIFGATKDQIKSSYSGNTNIPTGDYLTLAFEMDQNTLFMFAFNENEKCKAFIIRKPASEFQNAKLILSSDFPNKSVDGMEYWDKKVKVKIRFTEDNERILILHEPNY